MLSTTVDVEASHATFDAEAGYVQWHAGARMWKTADDLDRYRKVIEATRPEVLVETGTHWGGSAAWFAAQGVQVVTVDVIAQPEQRVADVTYLRGSSIDPQIAGTVAELVGGRRCMVSLDSDHHAPHVAEEIRLYGPLVSPGCYLVVEDGLADLVTAKRARRFGSRIPAEGGPLVAIEQTLACDPTFERDIEIEGLTPISHHPAGFWVRRG